uniref:Uncharacterized protein n=1 Tax=Setaria viridis TaxID=4556 RepID=A0A4U6UW56_SETVI|nr:hypothetical protein SEVIR_4G197401v2 [Setaria viridis]
MWGQRAPAGVGGGRRGKRRRRWRRAHAGRGPGHARGRGGRRRHGSWQEHRCWARWGSAGPGPGKAGAGEPGPGRAGPGAGRWREPGGVNAPGEVAPEEGVGRMALGARKKKEEKERRGRKKKKGRKRRRKRKRKRKGKKKWEEKGKKKGGAGGDCGTRSEHARQSVDRHAAKITGEDKMMAVGFGCRDGEIAGKSLDF